MPGLNLYGYTNANYTDKRFGPQQQFVFVFINFMFANI